MDARLLVPKCEENMGMVPTCLYRPSLNNQVCARKGFLGEVGLKKKRGDVLVREGRRA